MRRLLITGEAGFVGQNILRMRDVLREAHGWDLFVADKPYELRDQASLAALVDAARPQAVIHLAGISFVPDALRDPEGTFQINVLGTLRLLQSLKSANFSGAFLYVSSGDVYGRLSPEELPVAETRMPRPINPYATSKVAAEALCYQWSQTEAFERVVIARPFNHIGVGQREDFVVSSVARQIVRIQDGKQEPVIQTGNIDVTRDFLDVTDVIRAYLALLENGENGEVYNVCSSRERAIREIIEALLKQAGITVDLQTDPARLRPSDQKRAAGDNRKLAASTAWRPMVPLEQTLQNILDYWKLREQ